MSVAECNMKIWFHQTLVRTNGLTKTFLSSRFIKPNFQMPNNIFGHAKQDYLRSNRRKPNNFGLGSPEGDIFNEVEPRSRE